MIQITHLKTQQVLNKVIPDGVFVDIDGLVNVDLGNGTTYNVQEALNMYFQTGSMVGRSLTQEGDPSKARIPIQQVQNSAGIQKLQSLISTYQYYLQMIRDVTGLNEAVDGSSPDKNALVGLQKLAAANSNVATRHILQSLMYITVRTCENISLRVADMIQYPLTKNALKNAISSSNVQILKEMEKLNMHEFGIFLELEPEEEDKAVLQQNIQIALKSGAIDLEDSIDISQVSNIKLANQLLKVRKRKKLKELQKSQQDNMKMQADLNAQNAEKAAMAEVQKQQALAQTQLQIEQGKSKFKIDQLQQEANIKKQLMAEEFNYKMQLARVEVDKDNEKLKKQEDRKDERTRIQATQQSELIEQRKNDSTPKTFESSGSDNLNGFNLGSFEPS